MPLLSERISFPCIKRGVGNYQVGIEPVDAFESFVEIARRSYGLSLYFSRRSLCSNCKVSLKISEVSEVLEKYLSCYYSLEKNRDKTSSNMCN